MPPTANTANTATAITPPPSPGTPDINASDTPKSLANTIYTSVFPTLPKNGPPGQAHILDLSLSSENIENNAFTLQDAIATTLFHISPTTLSTFLSPKNHIFKAVFRGKQQDIRLVVWRKGCEVFVGTFEHHTSLRAYRFEHLAGCLIGYDGSWHMVATASNTWAAAKWGDVWTGKFECQGGVAKMSVEVEKEGMESRAGVLARVIMNGRFWEGRVDVKSS